MKKIVIKEETVDDNPKDEHENKLVFTFKYYKGSPTCDEIDIATHCTVADQVAAFIRLAEVLAETKTSKGRGLTDFICTAMRAYAEKLAEDDDEDEDDD